MSKTIKSKSGRKLDIGKVDANMVGKKMEADGLCWRSPLGKPFRLDGFYWFPKHKLFRRMPLVKLPEGVEAMACHTAGGQLRFRSDTKRLSIRASLLDASVMYHMAQTGSCGFDLYLGKPGEQRFRSVSIFTPGSTEYECELMKKPIAQMREFTLNFPLYSGVDRLEIGLDEGASLQAPSPFEDIHPVVIYGTSIIQGGCASRPGHCLTNILSRRMNRPFINLGFSASGKGEPEVAEIMAQIRKPEPSLFILDYEANTPSTESYRETIPNFIRILRQKHPRTPILLVSRIRFSYEVPEDGAALQDNAWRKERFELQTKIVKDLRGAGDRNLHFLDGGILLGEDYDECTVDGIHPIDFGFQRMASAIEPVIRRLIRNN
ncbi:MAG: hypothetical protein A2X49_03150 [Lentisphaerae bacterium GWF2_52_8]|nr:MAG: hypothetical protein A2X49_03150 [Lentisphaerae bacterium GWF2_52_8]